MATPLPPSFIYLTCAVCLDLFQEPKLLECSHTFCLKCIKKLLKEDEIRCPVCRKVTNVKNKEISKLPQNFVASSIIEGMQTEMRCSAMTEGAHNEPAEYYCLSCQVYFCYQCKKTHDAWGPNKRHIVIIPWTNKREHDNHTEDYHNIESAKPSKKICAKCNKMLSGPSEENAHLSKQHEIMDESEYTSRISKHALDVQRSITDTVGKIQVSRTVYNELESLVMEHSYVVIKEINTTYNDLVRKLDDWKLNETKKCQTLQESVSQSRARIDEIMNDDIHTILTEGRTLEKALRNSDNITVQATLCDNLSRILKTANERLRDSKLETQTNLAMNMSLCNKCTITGGIQIRHWNISTMPLVQDKAMTSIDVSKNGKIAVSYFKGGLWLTDHENRGISKLYLEDIESVAVAFLSDGYIALRDAQNQIKLFRSDMTPVAITFNTLSHERGVHGGLAVDKSDNIYISYRQAKIIQVFSRRGGAHIQEIACGIYKPQQIAIISHQQIVVMDGEVIAVVNEEGTRMHEVQYAGCYGYPAVSSDGSVLIAWVDKRFRILRIDKYNTQLDLVKSVHTNNMVSLSERSDRDWYYLKELPGGALAFCTTVHLMVIEPHIRDNAGTFLDMIQDSSTIV